MNGRMQIRSTVFLLVIGLMLLPWSALAAQARNIILLIGDGMGPSQFGAARLYSNRVVGKDLRMVEVMKDGRTAYVVNETADSTVTESAAAATQIACGVKVPARAAGMGTDGKTPCTTILEMAKAGGKATGLVTTSGITDATPASFSAHVPHRSDEVSVAAQELGLGVDVLMGGRKIFFLPEASGGKRKDGRNLLDEAKKAGYAVVGTADELRQAPDGKILGLFNMGNMAFEIDRPTTREPSLAEMTLKTLQVLSKSPKGFFAMIEGGRIDHAAHRNDAAATIRDMLAFDAAVGAALDFARQNPDTLLIVTADHETGGMALMGQSKESGEYVGMDFKAIEKSQVSFETLAEGLGKNPPPEKIKAAVKQHLAIDLTDEEVKIVAGDTLRKMEPANYNYPMLHSLAFVLRPYLRVGWGSQTHTASPLFAFGTGPGSERVRGLLHNTELFTIMRMALE
ncbi:MAG: alkaline phosphatase [Syntrophales bacterium]